MHTQSAMPCSSFFFSLSVLNDFWSDHMTAILGSHMIHITSIKNGGKFLVYNVSKYEQNRSKCKEIIDAEERAPPLKDKFYICFSMLEVKWGLS